MPNWCSTEHAFFTENEDRSELVKLHLAISSAMKTPSGTPNNFEPGWLFKIAEMHRIDPESVPCRGSITHLDELAPSSNHFKLSTETAWAPMAEMWDAVLEKYEGVFHVYTAEECGQEIYVNTDEEGLYFPNRYLLEIYGQAPMPEYWPGSKSHAGSFDIKEYFASFKEVKDYCEEVMGKTFYSLKKLKEYLSETFDNEDNASAIAYKFTTE